MTTAKPVTTNTAEQAGQITHQPEFTWGPYVDPRRNPANWLTFFGFASGVVAIGLAEHKLLLLTLICMVFSSIMDLSDGTIARLTGTVNLPYPLGHQLDFAADLTWAVGGGAALMYYGQLHELYLAGAAVSILWCVCGMARLARYTVMGHSHDGYYIGCPAPLAADIMLFTIMINAYVVRFSAVVTAAIGVALSAAMVSWFQLPGWAKFGSRLSDQIIAWELGRKFNSLLSSATGNGGKS